MVQKYTDEGISCYPLFALKIKCRAWFERDDFKKWLESKGWESPAVWSRPYTNRTEVSEAFVVFSSKQTYLEQKLPSDIRRSIQLHCEGAGMCYGVVWLIDE